MLSQLMPLRVAFLLSFLTATVVAQTRVTFFVKCGSQGILDAPYEIFVKVKVPRADPLDAPQYVEVKVSIPNRADSEFITGAIKAKLNSLIEPPNATVSTGEITGTPEPSDDDKLKKHDLVLPKPIVVMEVTATRQGNDGDGGQLQVIQ